MGGMDELLISGGPEGSSKADKVKAELEGAYSLLKQQVRAGTHDKIHHLQHVTDPCPHLLVHSPHLFGIILTPKRDSAIDTLACKGTSPTFFIGHLVILRRPRDAKGFCSQLTAGASAGQGAEEASNQHARTCSGTHGE
jgi:hypothetical protein